MDEQEERPDYFGHFIRMIILCWSLCVMTLGYMERIRLDTFAAGLVGNIASAYGISIKGKSSGNGNKIAVDNSKNKVGIK
nr:hypothetical protein [uncultured Mediterranean phage uvMED]BAR26478.1 hypothetical protein [uncultured Mediterranean phage uvMED]